MENTVQNQEQGEQNVQKNENTENNGNFEQDGFKIVEHVTSDYEHNTVEQINMSPEKQKKQQQNISNNQDDDNNSEVLKVLIPKKVIQQNNNIGQLQEIKEEDQNNANNNNIKNSQKKSMLNKKQQQQQQQGVSLLSYKAEIIWDPQPTTVDFYYNPGKHLIKQQQNTGQYQSQQQYQRGSGSAGMGKKSQSMASIPRNTQQILTPEQLEMELHKKTQVPFVNLEKDNYLQDIASRKQYYGTLRSENNSLPFSHKLLSIAKPVPQKKRRRHKTKFKIVKNSKNIDIIQNVCKDYISDHRKMVNEEIIKLPNYEKSAPFLPSSLQFVDQLIEEKQLFKEKYGYDEKNLIKNKCVLEQVVLSRLDKKQRQREKVKVMKKPLNINEIANEEELVKIQQDRLQEELDIFQKAQNPQQIQNINNNTSRNGTQHSGFQNENLTNIDLNQQQQQKTNNYQQQVQLANNYNNYRNLKELEKSQQQKRSEINNKIVKKNSFQQQQQQQIYTQKSQPVLPKIQGGQIQHNMPKQ